MSNGEFMSKRIKTQVEEEEEQGWWFLQYNIGLKSVFGWEVSEAVCVSKFCATCVYRFSLNETRVYKNRVLLKLLLPATCVFNWISSVKDSVFSMRKSSL